MPHLTPPSRSPLRRSRFAIFALRLVALFTLAALFPPLAGTPASANQPAGLPDNVLQSSVRVITFPEVTPDDEDEAPFLCMLDEETLFEYSIGSGTVITEDGYVLTNHHVIDPPSLPREARAYCEDQAPRGRADVEFALTVWIPDAKGNPAEPYRAEVVQDSSRVEDLAILRITEHLDGSPLDLANDPFSFVQFGDSDALREPEQLFMVGYPANAGITRVVSEGIFSGWGDNGNGVPWIYTDATTSGGNSGGTAVNSSGLLIGIPTRATLSDCRPGDTNADGVLDENDQGCVGLGGNFGILIPSNLARVFAEDAIGQELPVIQSETPVDPDAGTPVPDDPDPANADGPPFGEIEFTAYDVPGSVQDSFENANRIDGCFENLAARDGQAAVATWYLDDEVYLVIDFEWDEAWNPEGCVTIEVTEAYEAAGDVYLDPGVYRLEIETAGQTVVSDDVTVTASTQVDEVSFRGRTSDGDAIAATDENVLAGELVTVYADIAFADMTEGSIWQAEWYLDGELAFASDPEAWEGEASGTDTARLRNPDRGPLAAGTYEVVISIDGVEGARATVVIED